MPVSTNSNQFGASYLFGFQSSDAPSISGFVARSAELRFESETFAQATDGEGITEAVVTTAPQARKVTATFTGYLTSGFNPATISASFSFLGRFYIVRNVTQPKRKGEFNEATVEAESYFLVTS